MPRTPHPYRNGELVIVLDCADLDRATLFWSQVLGYTAGTPANGPYHRLIPAGGAGIEVLLQRVPDPKGGKNRVHLDLRTADLDAEVARVLGLGATQLTGQPVAEDGWYWHVLADPDGNEFCVLQPPEGAGSAGQPTRRWRRNRKRHASGDIAQRAAELATQVSEEQQPKEQRKLAKSLAVAARSGARAAGRGTRAARRGVGLGSGWLAAEVVAMAPRLRVRDRAALQAQFPGMSVEEMADALIDGAAKSSGAVGAVVGAWAMLPVLPAWPAEIATETLAVVGIEIKLIAELHEAYAMPAPGGFASRMTAYVAAWAQRRAVVLAPGGLVIAAGSPLARRLRRRLAARAGRSALSLGPLLTGAAAGAILNRRETRRLGQEIRTDLRRRAAASLES